MKIENFCKVFSIIENKSNKLSNKNIELSQLNVNSFKLNTTNKETILSLAELNSLHHVADYIVSSIIKTNIVCRNCINCHQS